MNELKCKCGKKPKLDGSYFLAFWWYSCEECKIIGAPGDTHQEAENNFRAKLLVINQ